MRKPSTCCVRLRTGNGTRICLNIFKISSFPHPQNYITKRNAIFESFPPIQTHNMKVILFSRSGLMLGLVCVCVCCVYGGLPDRLY